MRLLPLAPEHLDRVAEWLGEEENYKWLDFGAGGQPLTKVTLRMMSLRDLHCLRLFEADAGAGPCGIVALSDINREFRTAVLWYVLGEKSQAARGLTSKAVGLLLDHGRREVGLHQVRAWAVEANAASIRVLEKNGFRRIGRERACHRIQGVIHDRIHFDRILDAAEPLHLPPEPPLKPSQRPGA